MSELIGIFDQNFRQLLTEATPMAVAVKEDAKLPEHPLENGSVINDHKIFNPIEIEIPMFMGAGQYKSLYAIVRQLYFSAALLTVQTKTATYPRMTIAALPHEEKADMVDAIIMSLRFKEIRFAPAQYGVLPPSSVLQPADSSTQDRGEQLPQKQSFLSGLFN